MSGDILFNCKNDVWTVAYIGLTIIVQDSKNLQVLQKYVLDQFPIDACFCDSFHDAFLGNSANKFCVVVLESPEILKIFREGEEHYETKLPQPCDQITQLQDGILLSCIFNVYSINFLQLVDFNSDFIPISEIISGRKFRVWDRLPVKLNSTNTISDMLLLYCMSLNRVDICTIENGANDTTILTNPQPPSSKSKKLKPKSSPSPIHDVSIQFDLLKAVGISSSSSSSSIIFEPSLSSTTIKAMTSISSTQVPLNLSPCKLNISMDGGCTIYNDHLSISLTSSTSVIRLAHTAIPSTSINECIVNKVICGEFVNQELLSSSICSSISSICCSISCSIISQLISLEQASTTNPTPISYHQSEHVQEVSIMLDSSVPIYLTADATIGSDSDAHARCQHRLLLACRRTMAVCFGGVAFGLSPPDVIEGDMLLLNVSKICLCAKMVPHHTLVFLDDSLMSSEMLAWPEFHFGVTSCMLQVSKNLNNQVKKLNRSWLCHHKLLSARPVTHNNYQYVAGNTVNTHAGVLFCVGLLGYLNASNSILLPGDLLDYLSLHHDQTTIGLLLGLSLSRRGSCHLQSSSVLMFHSSSSTSTCSAITAAAYIGLGFVHCASHDVNIAMILLQKMSGSISSCVDDVDGRELISNSCGIALGLVLMKRKQDCDHDDIVMRLVEFVRGGPSSSSSSSSHSRILIPPFISTYITQPSALLAICIMYLRSNNRQISNLFALPSTWNSLSNLRPDSFHLFILTKCLILWDDITASHEWIKAQIPSSLIEAISADRTGEADVCWYSTLYWFGVSACLLAIALKHTSCHSPHLKSIMLHYVRELIDQRCRKRILRQNRVIMKEKSSIDVCLSSTLLSLALVMCGSCDEECLTVLKSARRRVDADVSYGTHVAIQLSLGLVFLGKGRLRLKCKDNNDIVNLLLSVLPRFPSKASDQSTSLQPLRHLWLLAIDYDAVSSIVSGDVSGSGSVESILSSYSSSSDSTDDDCMLYKLCRHYVKHSKHNSDDYRLFVRDYDDAMIRKLVAHKTLSFRSFIQSNSTNQDLMDKMNEFGVTSDQFFDYCAGNPNVDEYLKMILIHVKLELLH